MVKVEPRLSIQFVLNTDLSATVSFLPVKKYTFNNFSLAAAAAAKLLQLCLTLCDPLARFKCLN